MCYFSVITGSPNQSVGFFLAELSFTHPVIPLVEVLGATTLGVTTSCVGLRGVFSQGILAFLRKNS